jgi:hypothetical protein
MAFISLAAAATAPASTETKKVVAGPQHAWSGFTVLDSRPAQRAPSRIRCLTRSR